MQVFSQGMGRASVSRVHSMSSQPENPKRTILWNTVAVLACRSSFSTFFGRRKEGRLNSGNASSPGGTIISKPAMPTTGKMATFIKMA